MTATRLAVLGFQIKRIHIASAERSFTLHRVNPTSASPSTQHKPLLQSAFQSAYVAHLHLSTCPAKNGVGAGRRCYQPFIKKGGISPHQTQQQYRWYRLGVKSLRCGCNNSEEPLVRFQLPTYGNARTVFLSFPSEAGRTVSITIGGP